MTKFLVSDVNPSGFKLEDILIAIRKDVLHRCAKIENDPRAEALHVMDNNMKILGHLSEAIKLATDSSKVLDKSFGPSVSMDGGEPRIGNA